MFWFLLGMELQRAKTNKKIKKIHKKMRLEQTFLKPSVTINFVFFPHCIESLLAFRYHESTVQIQRCFSDVSLVVVALDPVLDSEKNKGQKYTSIC